MSWWKIVYVKLSLKLPNFASLKQTKKNCHFLLCNFKNTLIYRKLYILSFIFFPSLISKIQKFIKRLKNLRIFYRITEFYKLCDKIHKFIKNWIILQSFNIRIWKKIYHFFSLISKNRSTKKIFSKNILTFFSARLKMIRSMGIFSHFFSINSRV